ncbi:MAG: LysM peptidoglycan-binding domain-containing protein [Kofleriaceae bacterium]
MLIFGPRVSRVARRCAGLALAAALLVSAPAAAQGPMVDPGGAPAAEPTPPAPAPAQPAAPTTVIIPFNPQTGQPIPQGPQEPTAVNPDGFYHYDQGQTGGFDEPVVLHSGPTPELHVVRSGDTLWDICFYYFNDPWQWPKIWSYNAQITNPHWIYPGDLVRMIPRGVFFGAAEPAPEEGPAPRPAEPDPDDPRPAPARRVEVSLRQTAFVEQDELERSIKIDGAVDEKVLLSSGDEVYLTYPSSKPPKVGKLYSVYVEGGSVSSGGSTVGAYVRLLGSVRVVSVKKGKRARAVIVTAREEIERGAKVGPLLTTFKSVPPVAPKVNVQGTIVAMLGADQLIGQGELVFLDIGSKSGVVAGNRLTVVRRGDAYDSSRGTGTGVGQDDRRFPARALGEVVVVEVGKKIAIGMVTLAVQEFGIGDLVMMQKAAK